MPERKAQDEIESIILEFLAGQTEPVSKQSIIIKVYGPVYDDSLGRTVTQAFDRPRSCQAGSPALPVLFVLTLR